MAEPLEAADELHEEQAPISVPDSGEGGKLSMIMQLIKKSLGVKDIATMRLSLPASLLEPIPNLEYWHYLDRPDIFAAINDSNDPFDRMVAVIRFALTKDLKFVHGKVCKPYNSVLGEHFRAHWDFLPVAYPDEPSEPPIPLTHTIPPSDITSPPVVSETASVRSGRSSKSTRSGLSLVSKAHKSPSTAATSPQQLPETNLNAQMSNLSLDKGSSHSDVTASERLRVVYVTEQVSHHPPVSAYYATCPSKSLELYGVDQISAKVSGTTVRVSPGKFNKGIFVKITGGPGEGEQYNITHPIAHVNGLLRGHFYVTVSDTTIISCTGGNQPFRAIIEYKEESWLGKARFRLEGIIHTVVEGETQGNEWVKIEEVPKSRVVAVFDGSWRGHVRWRRVGNGSYSHSSSASSTTSLPQSASSSPAPSHSALPVPSPLTPTLRSAPVSRTDFSTPPPSGDGEYATLLDLTTLQVVPKSVRPLEKQDARESRRLWDSVTSRLLSKEYSEATREKVAIEQKQRDEAAERKRKGVTFVPRYFEQDMDAGFALLTAEGRKAVEEELKEDTPFCAGEVEGGLSAEASRS